MLSTSVFVLLSVIALIFGIMGVVILASKEPSGSVSSAWEKNVPGWLLIVSSLSLIASVLILI